MFKPSVETGGQRLGKRVCGSRQGWLWGEAGEEGVCLGLGRVGLEFEDEVGSSVFLWAYDKPLHLELFDYKVLENNFTDRGKSQKGGD